MLIEPDYRGHRIQVDAIAAGDRWNAEVRILRLFSREKPHVETVRCLDGDEGSQVLTAAGQTMGAAFYAGRGQASIW